MDAMKRHSPSPWTRPSKLATHILDAKGRQIADFFHPNDMSADEGFANARLAELAPELLEALEAISDAFDRYDAAMTKHGYGHNDYSGTRSKARDLIRRAKL